MFQSRHACVLVQLAQHVRQIKNLTQCRQGLTWLTSRGTSRVERRDHHFVENFKVTWCSGGFYPPPPPRNSVLCVIIKAFSSEGILWKRPVDSFINFSKIRKTASLKRWKQFNSLSDHAYSDEHVDRTVRLTIFGITNKDYFVLFLFALLFFPRMKYYFTLTVLLTNLNFLSLNKCAPPPLKCFPGPATGHP